MPQKTPCLVITLYFRLAAAVNTIFTQTISNQIAFTADFIACAQGCAELALTEYGCTGFNYRPSKCSQTDHGCTPCTYEKHPGQSSFDFVLTENEHGVCKEVQDFNWLANFACPTIGMAKFSGNCYWVGEGIKTRSEAATICQSKGGKLASIESYGENWFLTMLAYVSTCTTIKNWLPGTVAIGGLYDVKAKKVAWDDGSTAAFSAFYYPDERQTAILLITDNCGDINSLGFWTTTDLNSTWVPKFACKAKGIVK